MPVVKGQSCCPQCRFPRWCERQSTDPALKGGLASQDQFLAS